MTTKTFSTIWTDELGEAIKLAVREDFAIEVHPTSGDYAALSGAINQGIDSHLEAIHFKQLRGAYGKTRLVIEQASVPVLVRRLMESGDSESLAVSICEVLGIELI